METPRASRSRRRRAVRLLAATLAAAFGLALASCTVPQPDGSRVLLGSCAGPNGTPQADYGLKYRTAETTRFEVIKIIDAFNVESGDTLPVMLETSAGYKIIDGTPPVITLANRTGPGRFPGFTIPGGERPRIYVFQGLSTATCEISLP